MKGSLPPRVPVSPGAHERRRPLASPQMLDDVGPSPGASGGAPSTVDEPGAGRETPTSTGSHGRRLGLLLALGVAVLVMVVAGVGIGLTRSGGIGASSSPAGSVPPPALAPRPAAPDFAPLRSNGQPPADVMDALVVPTGASAISHTNYDQANGPYDRGVGFGATASSQELLNFFRFELAANHWSNRTEAPARGGPGTQVLARHKSSDGFYWEVGVTVRRAPDQPPDAVSNSQFDIRLLQNVEG